MAITIRLRHPKGISTLTLDPGTTTIEDLGAMVFSTAEIMPDEQELKYSYPPKLLPTDPSMLLSSIPITKGEQIIVTLKSPSSSSPTTRDPPKQAERPVIVRPPGPPPIRQSGPVSSRTAELPRAPNPPAEAPSASKGKGLTTVELPGGMGTMTHVIVPDDNSCLFSSIGVVFLGGMDSDIVTSLRQVVADAIRSNPDVYSDVFLGRPRTEYISTITKPQAWGGAIELSILANHFKTEIDSFDVLTGRVDRFGEGQYDSRCILVYSGIHYDAVTTSPIPDAPREFQTSVFPLSDDTILPAAKQLVGKLKDQRYYTDTAGFDLRCNVCKAGLIGEKGAREHAKATGHVEFGEY